MRLLFFHRLDLVHLYAPLSKKLVSEHEIIHVAFSNKEVDILRNEYHIENKIYNLSALRDSFYDSLTFINDKLLELDEFIINNTNGRFCLNSSINIDRTYKKLSYEDSCNLSITYYEVWKYIFDESKPELFFHELPALMMIHLAVMFCKRNNAKYLTQIQVSGKERFQWIFLEGDDANFIEYNLNENETKDPKLKDETIEFINKSNSNLNILLNDISNFNKEPYKFRIFVLIRGLFGSAFRALKNSKFYKIDPRDHIDQFLIHNHKNFFVEIENLFGRLYDSYYSEPSSKDKYYFYPLHLEPEAVVLYYGGGWYEGQMKLIENIAAQLPPNTYLYVKDHPNFGNYRDVKDYKRLLKIPNLKLIDPKVSAKKIIKDSLGVITINGTPGFEAFLMNKKVFCFGKAFYKDFKGVIYVEHIKQLRKKIYDSSNIYQEIDINDIQKFLASSHLGFVSFFSGRHNKMGIDLNNNTEMIVKGIKKLINRIELKS